MSDVITPNLGLTLPTVLVSPGPTYANEINADLALIDSTVFSPNNKVPTSGLNINADLPINQNNVNNARSYRFFNNGAELTGPSDISAIYEFNNDLYWNNPSGFAVKITNGTGLNPSSPTFLRFNISGNYLVNPSDIYNYYDVTTVSGALSITLPAASSLASGRFYYIKDVGGSAQTNNITLIRNGSDTFDSTAGNLVLSTSLGGWIIVSNGISNWDVFYTTTKLMMNGRFGTDIQSVLVQGNSVAVKATGTNSVLIGNTSNTVTIGGDAVTINPTTSLNISTSAVSIAGSSLTVNSAALIVNSASSVFNHSVVMNDALTINGATITHAGVTINGNTILNGDLTATGTGTIGGLLTASDDAIFGSSTSNAVTILGTLTVAHALIANGTTTINAALNVNGGPITSNGAVNANGLLTIAGGATATSTITISGAGSGGVLLDKNVFVTSGTPSSIVLIDYNVIITSVNASVVYTFTGTGAVGYSIKIAHYVTSSCDYVGPWGTVTLVGGSGPAPKIVDLIKGPSSWYTVRYN